MKAMASTRPASAPPRLSGAAAPERPQVVFDLYISGPTSRSALAIVNIRRLCEKHLRGRYLLSIIDLSQTPAAARLQQIVAAPTLVRRLPAPERRFIGDLSQRDRVLAGLEID